MTVSYTSGPSSASDLAGAQRLLREFYGIEAKVQALPSDRDWNFRVEQVERRWVLKLANPTESVLALEFEHAVMAHLAQALPGKCPQAVIAKDGATLLQADCPGGVRWVRLLTWMEGELLAGQACGATTWSSLGVLLAQLDSALANFSHDGAKRQLEWDLAQSDWVLDEIARLEVGAHRRAAEASTLQFLGEVKPRLASLPSQVIHHDGNDLNLLAEASSGGARVTGIFDFGDALHTQRVFEIAVAGAYAMYLAGEENAVDALVQLTAAYHQLNPLCEAELLVLFPAARQRMLLSALMAEVRVREQGESEYARVHQAAAWKMLQHLLTVSMSEVEAQLRTACAYSADGAGEGCHAGLDRSFVESARQRHSSPTLSLSYERPLEIVRGRGTFLFDKSGSAYLDCVNNVCHVGHCHPRVVEAASAQMARLNTNTRYLSDAFASYTSRLASLFPDPLEVVFLVNSGSEANELALRLAYTATGRRGVIATSAGYHGNTQALVDVSAYKHDRKGGWGAPDWVAKVDNPDDYRGRFRKPDPQVAHMYAVQVTEQAQQLRDRGFEAAAFLIEALPGCGGQTVPPAGYLQEAFALARAEGALCIADEVQIGFGRVGSHWWGFEEQGALPDIVTMGKPIGNGHPMAAVVTTRAIADAFHTGMEWFNTFGGNPVSCATGLAVLDVIEAEGLRERAFQTGAFIQDGLRDLAESFPVIGEVRGKGMYLGAEFVQTHGSRQPNSAALKQVLEQARACGVLLSSDGPDNNVLKIKPPIVFGLNEAKLMLASIAHGLKSANGIA